MVASIIIPTLLPVPVIPSHLHFHFILYMFNCDYPLDGLRDLRCVSMLDPC